MKVKTINKMVLASLFAAIICVVTLVVHIPIGGGFGYINIADAFIICAGLMLGPVYGGLAAAIGSGLSDIILSYAIYAPATAVIKALVAILAYYIYKLFTSKIKIVKTKENISKIIAIAIAAVIGELPMAFLYLLYEWFVLKYGSACIVDLPLNLIQGAISAFIGIFLMITLEKTNIKEKYLWGNNYEWNF